MSQAPQNPNTTAYYRQPAAASLDRFHNDDNGVETEKGPAPLLEDPTAVEVLGLDLVFELPAVLTQQEGREPPQHHRTRVSGAVDYDRPGVAGHVAYDQASPDG
jgi:hypothetical protein